MNESILATRREITGIKSQIESSEYELNEMKKQWEMAPLNSIREDEFKRELVSKNKNYKR